MDASAALVYLSDYSYAGSADELNRGYFDDMSELKQHADCMTNKILILKITARKFPTVDVIYSDGRKSKLPIIFYASGIDASKLVVPEASLICLSFRANSQDALQRHVVYSFGDHYYFRKELKILNLLTGMNRFTVFGGLNFVAENLGVEFFKGTVVV
ncbi:hypothetical protein J1N35_014164 [Gossypium stocksii]|uniref:Uncharacterized protein n=1 Tax=Gossypium stocksii TaxID=47602 RepID=A0A9D3VV21_9ROSI|nr:hypothetical protein J1N35_014164 [Gossypium stocksii]